MALTAGTLWEIRSGGNDINGAGFYDRDPGTSVDYSQQDASEASFTNLTTAGAGATTITDGDAGGLFTAAMAGNVIRIPTSGVNFTFGYYEIITFTDSDNVVLDRSPTPGGAGSGGDGEVGGGKQTITDVFLEGVTAGDFIYLENGTYTPGALNIVKDGTPADPITFEGYFSTRGDDPTDANRPLIQDGGNALSFSGASFWVFKNLRFECSNSNGFWSGTESVIRNCKSSQSGAADGDRAFRPGTRTIVFDCEAENTNGGAGNQGTGIYLFSGDVRIIGCYIHDCKFGIQTNAGNQVIMFNIIDGGDQASGYGIYLNSEDRCTVAFNTVYNCFDGILAGAGGGGACLVFGNIVESCFAGASWISPTRDTLMDYNNWNDNNTDTSGIAKGENATAVAPQFTNPGTDFSLQSGSLLREAVTVIRIGTH